MKALATKLHRLLALRTSLNIVLVVGLVALAAGSFSSIGVSAQSSVPPRTAKVAIGTVLSSVSANGNVQAGSTRQLNFSTGGTITEVDVKTGDHVTTGQVLARIDSTTAQKTLDAANASLVAAQAKVANAQTAANPVASKSNNSGTDSSQAKAAVDKATQQLRRDQQTRDQKQATLVEAQRGSDPGAIAGAQQDVFMASNAVSSDQQALSSAQLQESIAAVASQNSSTGAVSSSTSTSNTDTNAVTNARTQVDAAQTALDATVLKAPSEGTVAAMTAKVGDVTGSTSSSVSSQSQSQSSSGTSGTASSSSSAGLFTLTDLTTLGVKTGFSETDAGKVHVGQQAVITVDAAGTSPFSGTVDSIDGVATTTNNVVTYNAVVTIDKPTDAIKPGMTATVAVTVDHRDNVLHAPTTAVSGSGNNTSVKVLEAGKQTTTPVTVGLRGDDAIEIVSGVVEGEQIVTSSGVMQTGNSTNNRRSGTLTGGPGTGGAGGGRFEGGGAGGPGGPQ